MKKKKTLIFLILLLIPAVLLTGYLGSRTSPEILTVSPKIDRKTLPKKLKQPPPNNEPKLASTKQSPAVSVPGPPTPKPEAPPSVPLKKLPTQPAQVEFPKKRLVPDPSPVVLPAEEISPVRLCAGEPISPCNNCKLTHGDLALLLLDILTLATTQIYEEAFEILSSLHIRPAGGWAKTDPQKVITLKEAEEIRCSISLAFEEGSIRVGPSVVTTALNGFLREVQVSVDAIEHSGITKEGASGSAETGYQGGRRGVFSSAF